MNLGQDMIGTMSNTLIFAFTGGALTTMMVFCSYGIQFHQLLSSDFSGRGACAGSVQYRSRDFECSCCSRDGRGLLRKKQKTLIIK